MQNAVAKSIRAYEHQCDDMPAKSIAVRGAEGRDRERW